MLQLNHRVHSRLLNLLLRLSLLMNRLVATCLRPMLLSTQMTSFNQILPKSTKQDHFTKKIFLNWISHSRPSMVTHITFNLRGLNDILGCTIHITCYLCCYSCAQATALSLLKMNAKPQSTFISIRFTRWKKAPEKFADHKKYNSHRFAIMKLQQAMSLPIDDELSEEKATEQAASQEALLKLFSFIPRYL